MLQAGKVIEGLAERYGSLPPPGFELSQLHADSQETGISSELLIMGIQPIHWQPVHLLYYYSLYDTNV